jgi:predicted nucleic acid-binding protein
LDEGEAQCLAVLEQKPGAMFLTDDAAARMAGRQIGVEVHGSIGILALSIRRGQRTAQQILQLLDELPKRSTLYVTQALLDRVKERIRREFGIKL